MQVIKITHATGLTFDIPAPTQWDYQIAAVSSELTARSVTSGELMIDRVATKYKHEFTWANISWTQIDLILRAVRADVPSGSSGAVTFFVHFPSPYLLTQDAHNILKVKCYCGDITLTPSMFNDTPSKTRAALKLNVIEV